MFSSTQSSNQRKRWFEDLIIANSTFYLKYESKKSDRTFKYSESKSQKSAFL
jgi:hypothetical protein